MSDPKLTVCAKIKESTSIQLRGPSGRLYGILNLETLQISVRRGGQREPLESIDLGAILREAGILEEDQPPRISLL